MGEHDKTNGGATGEPHHPQAELARFKGVGPKTISCVLMFTLMRAEFPVDTHVWHIAKKLNWVPPAATRETTYLHLNERVDADGRTTATIRPYDDDGDGDAEEEWEEDDDEDGHDEL